MDEDKIPTTSAISTLTVEECRNECNGHSSPDSGVNDLSYERCSSASANSDSTPTDVSRPKTQPKRVEHRITVAADEQIRIHMGDTVRHVSGMC